jgi:hypothetical protein
MFHSIVDNKDNKKKRKKRGVILKITRKERDRPTGNPPVTKNFRYK